MFFIQTDLTLEQITQKEGRLRENKGNYSTERRKTKKNLFSFFMLTDQSFGVDYREKKVK